MKYAREIKVGALVLTCLFLLFFGFNFLKGVNIFSPMYHFEGRYLVANGLQEQSAVYIKGYKVGQVNRITYDFTRDSSFLVDISINKDIVLPYGTRMVLIQDGLLGGSAIELRLPQGGVARNYESGDMLATHVEPGLMSKVEDQLLAQVGRVVENVDSLVAEVNSQLADNHLHNTLANIDQVSSDLKSVSADVPQIVAGVQRSVDGVENTVSKAQSAVSKVDGGVDDVLLGVNRSLGDVNQFTANLKRVDLEGTVRNVNTAVGKVNTSLSKVDEAVDGVTALVSDVRSPEGTIGSLLYSRSLYVNLDSTVVAADSLLRDLKSNPKRYVHFSLFGCSKRDKKKSK